MQIKDDIKERLMSSWGSMAEAMECHCELKFIDPLTGWSCYIYAINPYNEDEIACIIHDKDVDVCLWSLQSLYNNYNRDGEYPIIDKEYRTQKTCDLYRKLLKRV